MTPTSSGWSRCGEWVIGLFIEYWLHFALGGCLYFVLCQYPGRNVRLAFVAFLAGFGIMGAWRLDLQAEIETRVHFELAVSVALAPVFWYFFERPFLNRRLPAHVSENRVDPSTTASAGM